MEGTTAAGFDISGALMADGDFSKVNFKESQLSKVRRTAPRHSPTPQPHAHAAVSACVYVCVESSDGKRVGCPTTSRAEHAAPQRALPACLRCGLRAPSSTAPTSPTE